MHVALEQDSQLSVLLRQIYSTAVVRLSLDQPRAYVSDYQYHSCGTVQRFYKAFRADTL